MAKILLTGGAGFMGSHITDDLIDLGHEVVVLDDLSGGFQENVNDKTHFVEGSILDVSLLTRLFEEHRFEYVYHLAAYAAEGLSHFIKRFNYNNNLIGSVNLINLAVNHGVKCFVFTSSIAVYGSAPVPMTEETIPEPEDPYGIAKLAVERELAVTHELFGLDHVIFRPHNVYGERQNIGDKYRNVVGIFMNQIMMGRPLTVFGDGEQARAFSYIRDISPVIARAPFEPKALNETFNIGAEKPYTVNELAREVARAMNADPEIRYLPPRAEAKEAYCSHEKLKRIFGCEAATDLPEGLRPMAEWVREVGSRKSRDFDEIEIEKNLPKIWRE